MSEQRTPEHVSLADLRRAIAACVNHQLADYEYMELRAEAWRTAFEWRDQFTRGDFTQPYAPHDLYEGMQLIREKLR